MTTDIIGDTNETSFLQFRCDTLVDFLLQLIVSDGKGRQILDTLRVADITQAQSLLLVEARCVDPKPSMGRLSQWHLPAFV